ncbi:MAG: cysteine desulfurase NifS [Acidimicrobiia bacterium]|nr:MAG: cysteine desulfurase NifS [Acidimicrobiia bacterium]
MPATEYYLDHASTTSMRPSAIEAIRSFTETQHGNASGQHLAARRAKNALEEARERASHMIGAGRPHDVIFTSGGTESDNLAVIGTAMASERPRVVVSAVEHKAVLAAASSLSSRDRDVVLAPVDDNGVVSVRDWEALVDIPTSLVSVQTANNEVGVIQPVAEIVERVRSVDSNVALHTDGAQSFVSNELDVVSLGVDLASLSGHKFGGPTGVGLLYVAPGTRIEPLIVGGGQEAGLRSGTSNVAGIVAMVAAMEETVADRDRFTTRTATERDDFESVLTGADRGVIVTANEVERLPHFSHVRVPGIDAETLLIRLDQIGVFASAGSACQSGAIEPSHVLTAMGRSATEAGECARFTFGWDSPVGIGQAAASAVLDVIGDLA